jgi:hypothetical protein
MSTLVVGRSNRLVRPGAPADESDWGALVPRDVPDPFSSQASPSRDEPTSLPGDRRTREASWVCEWWPPN